MNKYLNPKKYTRRALFLVNRYLLSHLEALFFSDPRQLLRHPPIFILGAPRSGSTLAIQVITDALDVGYLNNRHCQCFGAPAIAERLLCPLKNHPQSDYQSRHGVANGSYAPAECGEWWYRFFRRKPPYVKLKEVCPRRMRKFRQSVVALTSEFKKPVLFKNLYASLRVQAIAHYFPESLFIVIKRDEVTNGHSILEARYKRFRDYTSWFSVEPPNVEELKSLPAHQQVIEQIRHIHRAIDDDLRISGVAETRRFDLVYEDLCARPNDIIGEMKSFLETNGCLVNLKGDAPKRFPLRKEVRIDSVVYDQMVAYAKLSPTEVS
jgi:hypothetical protein